MIQKTLTGDTFLQKNGILSSVKLKTSTPWENVFKSCSTADMVRKVSVFVFGVTQAVNHDVNCASSTCGWWIGVSASVWSSLPLSDVHETTEWCQFLTKCVKKSSTRQHTGLFQKCLHSVSLSEHQTIFSLQPQCDKLGGTSKFHSVIHGNQTSGDGLSLSSFSCRFSPSRGSLSSC